MDFEQRRRLDLLIFLFAACALALAELYFFVSWILAWPHSTSLMGVSEKLFCEIIFGMTAGWLIIVVIAIRRHGLPGAITAVGIPFTLGPSLLVAGVFLGCHFSDACG